MADTSSARVCAECGARLEPGAEVCDLCGAPAVAEAPDAPRTCPACGTDNPAAAKFCLECGTALKPAATRPAAPPETAPEPASQKEAGQQAWVLVGMAVLIVLALYAVTLLSSQRQLSGAMPPAPVATAPDAPAPTLQPLAASVQEEVQRIESELEAAADDVARLGKLKDLQDVYVRAGRLDHAAEVQERIARLNDTADAWTLAGNLYFDWMNMQQDREQRIAFSRKAIVAYEESLRRAPENLDVKTDLAVAYLEDPNNPMQAVQLTREVLDANPDHLQANFNLGVMYNYIGRLDQAIAQFEKVQQLTRPDDPIHTRARQMLETVRQRQG